MGGRLKEIPIHELVEFCDRYNSIGYGMARIIELKKDFVVELYNAGFSENEELDTEFRNKYKSSIVLDFHPMMIAVFSKYRFLSPHVINFNNVEDLCDCYTSKKNYKYSLRIE